MYIHLFIFLLQLTLRRYREEKRKEKCFSSREVDEDELFNEANWEDDESKRKGGSEKKT